MNTNIATVNFEELLASVKKAQAMINLAWVSQNFDEMKRGMQAFHDLVVPVVESFPVDTRAFEIEVQENMLRFALLTKRLRDANKVRAELATKLSRTIAPLNRLVDIDAEVNAMLADYLL